MKKLLSIVLIFVIAIGVSGTAYAQPNQISQYGIKFAGENMAVPYKELLAISQKSLKVDPKLQSILSKRQAETILSPQEVFELSFGLFTEADLAIYLEEYRNCTLTISQMGCLTQIKSSLVTVNEK